MSANNGRKQVLIYLLLVFSISSIFYFLIIKSGHLGSAGGSYVFGIMWSPALAGILTKQILRQPISTLGWKWGNPRYQLWSYLIPLLYAAVAYMAVWIFHGGGFYDRAFIAHVGKSFGLGDLPNWFVIVLYLAFAATTGVIRSCSSALGEEIGWRGLLVPQLARNFSYTTTAFISGCVWSLWHFPILIFADYNAGTPTWYALSCFAVMVISISFVFAWMRLKSGSLWTAAILHGSHNLFIQQFFDPMTTDTGRTKYVIGEFGYALAIVSIVFAIYFWTRRNELPAQQEIEAANS